MRYDWRLFLNIVRWQPMILVSHDSLKESPRPPGYDASVMSISGRKLPNVFNLPSTDEERDQRRKDPREKKWRSKRQCSQMKDGDQCRRCKSNGDRGPHKTDEGAQVVPR